MTEQLFLRNQGIIIDGEIELNSKAKRILCDDKEAFYQKGTEINCKKFGVYTDFMNNIVSYSTSKNDEIASSKFPTIVTLKSDNDFSLDPIPVKNVVKMQGYENTISDIIATSYITIACQDRNFKDQYNFLEQQKLVGISVNSNEVYIELNDVLLKSI